MLPPKNETTENKANQKQSVSSRINMETYKKIKQAGNKQGHRFFDRTVAYIISHVLNDWASKENNNKANKEEI
tara:strand:+ start:11072 stop:11290 length:219 start_codon:yes stop_codon:yes gene_type:complete